MLQDGPRKLNLASLGALLGSFWTQLGPTWPQLGPILAPTWPNLARLGRSWRQLGSILALQVAPAGAQDPQLAPKCSKTALGSSTWPLLGPSWGHLGPHLAQLGPNLAPSWPQLAQLGASWPLLAPTCKDHISEEIGLIVRVSWALPAGLGGCAKRKQFLIFMVF